MVDRELVVHPQSESKEIVEFVEEKDEEWTVAGQPEELNELFETLTADWKVEERVNGACVLLKQEERYRIC